MITRKQLIKKYIDFFKTKDHKEIPNVSLIPENDLLPGLNCPNAPLWKICRYSSAKVSQELLSIIIAFM